MQRLKDQVWLLLLVAAGGVIAWLLIPSRRRNPLGFVLGCLACIAVLVWSGCRRTNQAYRYKDRYFARRLTWDLIDGQVVVIDNRSPRVLTLDPSFVLIFGAADGRRTGEQFVRELEAAYPSGAPSWLAKQIYQAMARMEAEGLIRFEDRPIQLPYYLSMPVSQQDKDRALGEMKKDGYIK